MGARAIVLMGFMGTGKSEVGRRLAHRLGRAFVDTDQLVEERAGKRVAAIFADDGEAAFRSLERTAVAVAVARGGAVIAVGGGAVLDAENVRRLREAGVLVTSDRSPRGHSTTHRQRLLAALARGTIHGPRWLGCWPNVDRSTRRPPT